MCRATRCTICHRTTWTGCGQHVESVRAGVPAADWCPGHPKAQAPARRGWLSRLLGR